MTQDSMLYYALGAAILALLYGVFLIVKILKKPRGEGKMLEIAAAIQDGAKAYLNRQYKTVGLVAVGNFGADVPGEVFRPHYGRLCFRRGPFRDSRICGHEHFR